jgi:PPM family protein phosphatase
VTTIFHNLFRKKTSEPVKTVPLSEADETKRQAKTIPIKYKPPQMILGTAQSVGLQRDHNEDALFGFNAILSENSSEYPFGIYIVADGMGGHQHGELASGTAARVMADHLINKIYLPAINSEMVEGVSIQEILQEGVDRVQSAVQNKVPGGGTTMTAAVVIGEQVTLAHIGDSRCYFISTSGHIEAVTHDHSLVQRLLDLGQISESDAQVHPQRNVLYRAIGQNEPFTADIESKQIPKPGYMLLCSDGLWGQVNQEFISNIILSAPNPSNACHQLIEAANAAGGPDNISAIIVQFLD